MSVSVVGKTGFTLLISNWLQACAGEGTTSPSGRPADATFDLS